VNKFSISELEQFSGVKAHTIRVWEQRYKAFKPMRSEGNTRYYDGLQLRRLLNIVSLMDNEFKVSALCTMSDEALNGLLETQYLENISSDYTTEFLISQCLSAAINFNEEKFDKLFSNALLRFGIKDAYVKIIHPLLIRIGIMWTKDFLPLAQEYFITNLIKQKLYAAIDFLPPPSHPEKTWLLFLMEDELHEIGLLFAHYLIRKAGHKVIYLGSNVPFNAVESVVQKTKPLSLLFFMVRKNDTANDLKKINRMKKIFPSQTIYMASDTSRLSDVHDSKNFIRLYSIEDLENIIIADV